MGHLPAGGGGARPVGNAARGSGAVSASAASQAWQDQGVVDHESHVGMETRLPRFRIQTTRSDGTRRSQRTTLLAGPSVLN